MKLAVIFGLGLVIAPSALAAQYVTSARSYGVAGMEKMGPGAQTTTLTRTPAALCPVGLQAQHLADGDIVKTGAGHPKGLGQSLHVTLTSPDSRTLAKATFTVQGWTAAGRIESARTSHASHAILTLQAPLKAGPGRSASADLWAPGLTAVDSVQLLSVLYTDGSTWAPAAGSSCRITPDPLMRIAK